MILFIWSGFILLILIFLALDLGVFHRKSHALSIREALGWTAVWITLALLFNLLIFVMYSQNWLGISQRGDLIVSGQQAALEFFTGYLIEKSLSLDNIFIIALIFSYFTVQLRFQHRVLYWGILGAIIMRGIMIGLGVALVKSFSWMNYVFGIFLIFTAVKMLVSRHDNLEPDKNPVVKLARRIFPVTDRFHEEKFWIKGPGRSVLLTPLFIVLLLIESSDVMFAIDSIPAIFAVTQDPFIIFTSNIFAILGLRALYFALAAVIEKFRYLKMSLVFLLAYMGVKMIIIKHFHIPVWVSLVIILGILSVGIIASVWYTHQDTARLQPPPDL
ncbi:MAG: TerC family protein [Calditrichaceae bacterium]|nr:TerC family protein [Calditrichaceae bacterium]MBN2710301.1 TerC family protein [Calditrichaceae bacterium]RQV93004.1 MAG: TerC family protein [Calditrichota bacterium]